MHPITEFGGIAVSHDEHVDAGQDGKDSSRVHLSIVVTVFSETFSIRETVGILLARDRGYIEEIILLISPRASAESFAIALECIQRDPRVKIQMQTRNPGIGWAYREGMQVASGNFVA